MEPTYARMLATAGHAYGAWLSVTLEVGGRSLRALADESARVASQAAEPLRAPSEFRMTAAENALWGVYSGQRRLLHGIAGMPTLWGMSYLHHLDVARRRAAR